MYLKMLLVQPLYMQAAQAVLSTKQAVTAVMLQLHMMTAVSGRLGVQRALASQLRGTQLAYSVALAAEQWLISQMPMARSAEDRLLT